MSERSSGSLGGPFGVRGGQGRGVERSGGPREVPEASVRGPRTRFLLFVFGGEFVERLTKY